MPPTIVRTYSFVVLDTTADFQKFPNFCPLLRRVGAVQLAIFLSVDTHVKGWEFGKQPHTHQMLFHKGFVKCHPTLQSCKGGELHGE